ncbi:MAG: sterol desaturase family protein [Pseudomonadota bacterium]|nr:sterol desaturase family protein [Pseudomonadota bacterium]
MASIVNTILSSSAILAIWLCGFFVTFTLLGRLLPCNPGQAWWRKDSWTDIAYFFILPVFTRFVRILFIGAGVFFIFRSQSNDSIQHYLRSGYGPLGALPLWLQAAAVFLLSDLLLYWTHRWFHGRTMWRFHAIHHSSSHVDWLSTYRFHPVNVWLTFTLVDVLMLFLGFSPEATAIMGGVNMMYSAMVHANLNWTFGPFKYVFASPVFHRWHHTAQEEGMDKNFAPTFPLLDIVFGTFYMPEGRRPEHYGVPGSNIPDHFIGQMIWPFKARR